MENGEIQGKGTRSYEDGTEYNGNFYCGEKHGYGEITYGTRNSKDLWYKGEWKMNVRSGFGQLMLRNGVMYKGNFENN